MDGHPVWLSEEISTYPPLRGRQQAEAVVIGGGLCGVTTAYLLAKGGLNVVLLEAGRLGNGASGHTMAKVTVQHGLIYSRLQKVWGQEVTRAYGASQSAAFNAMAELVEQMHIPCQWTWQSASLVAQTSGEEVLLEREESAAQEAGIHASLASCGDCPIPARRLLTLPAQAMFDPYAYLQALASAFVQLGGRIYEFSRVEAVSTQSVSTETGSVYAPFVVIATHFPIISFPGWYFLRLRQERSHVAAVCDVPAFEGMYLHIAPGGLSLRRQGGLTLLGAFDYKCGTQTGLDHGELLRQKGMEYFPDAKQVFAWHGQDLVPADGLPYIGPYSRRTPNHFVAAGFSKWGMTGSMAAAQIISAKILGNPLPEAEIYNPARVIRPGLSFILSNLGANTSARIAGLARKKAPRCPHMGCRLRYSAATASWECPCHGSRFDSIGRIKNTPAVHPAVIRNKNRPH